MAGHIAGLGYSVRVDSNGRPLVGWTLTVYQSGTSTPVTVFQDYSLSIQQSNPIVADAFGMLPMFWVADGTYRVRANDADGNELFDDDGIVALGPSSGTGGGGSGVDSNALFQTGDMLWVPVAGTRTGWVRANARTIGSAASGASERSNADCEDLFLFLWNTYSNTLCPVTGGRGISAAADWSANKIIATLDMRGRLPFGLDDMGNSAASVVAGATTAGNSHGAETASITIAQANLPNVNFSHTLTLPDHTHSSGSYAVGTSITNGTGVWRPGGTDSASVSGSGNFVGNNSTTSTLSLASGTVSGNSSNPGTHPSIDGTVPSGGSGTALTPSLLQPGRAGTWFFKL